MNDWQDETLEDYRSKGFGERSGYGERPALLVVDFINGFTDPSSPLGGDFSSELAVTKLLLTGFRKAGFPRIYTTIEYEHDFGDAGVFIKKVPSLSVLKKGSPLTKVDQRIAPEDGDHVIGKKFASSFFGTELDRYLKDNKIDTLVITGCTTSGCVRASAIDSLQYGYRTIVVREAVGDRAEGPHEANLFDIDAKYGDVVSVDEVMAYLKGLSGESDAAGDANETFQRWWHEQANTSD